MVDIETYRARIGSFGVSGLSTSKLKLKIKLRCNIQRQVSMECSVQTLIFLCMVTSTMLCVSLHCQEQGNTYTGTTPSHTDSLYSDTQLCIKCLFQHVHELYAYILESYMDKLTEISLFYTPSHRSNLALYIRTPGTNTQGSLMENVFNGTVHGTCSYLIGNVGSHAYNGNPPKNNERIIWDIHRRMVFKLSQKIAPSMGDAWNSFIEMFRYPDLLSDAEVAGVKNMFDVFYVLLRKGKIKYGEYEAVKDILSIMEFNTCLDIITEHEEQMTSASQDRQQGEESRSLQKNVDGLAEYVKRFGTAETAETEHRGETATSNHNKMPSVDMEASVKVWEDNNRLCYETTGIKDVVEKICSEEHSYICVVGEPGCGKTTAIRHAALYLKDKFGYIIYPVLGPKQFIDYLDPDKPQIGVIDDVIGEYFIDQDKLKVWDEYNEKIKDWLLIHKNTKFLFSLRVQLYSELKSKGNTHIYNDQRQVINFIDEEYKLSRHTMKAMLHHYLQVHHVQNIESLIIDVKWEEAEQFAGCFPLLCKVFSEDESVRIDPGKYFSNPWPALQNIFKQIKSKNTHQFCGLLLCGITDLKDEYFSPLSEVSKPKHFNVLIKSQKLDPDTDLDDIKQALDNLDGVYISHIGNRYAFLHSIFQNIVTFMYNDKYYVFKYATLDFIHTRVRLFSKFDTDDDYVKVFYGDDCVELLVDRMIEELQSDNTDRWWEGVTFVVNSHYIDNEELITSVIENIFDGKHAQITQDKIHKLFGKCLEAVCLYRPSPPHTDETSCPQYQLLLSLIARCDCNKQIDWLWPEYPLHVSVMCGALTVTKVLVQHQADVNVVDRYERCVLHWAVECTNNVELTKYLLNLPNLKCLNHRDKYGHTPYWYVVNNKSPFFGVVPHENKLIKLYKDKAAIL